MKKTATLLGLALLSTTTLASEFKPENTSKNYLSGGFTSLSGSTGFGVSFSTIKEDEKFGYNFTADIVEDSEYGISVTAWDVSAGLLISANDWVRIYPLIGFNSVSAKGYGASISGTGFTYGLGLQLDTPIERMFVDANLKMHDNSALVSTEGSWFLGLGYRF